MSTIITSMTAVNAAFLQEIKDDHRELHDAIDRLAHSFRHELSSAPWRSIVEQLRGLRDRLAMHFALEEAYGYCDDAIEVAPRLSERAEVLRGEHPVLYMRFNDIVDRAERVLFHETATNQRSHVSMAVMDFFHAFRQHERREGDLILEAYDQDIGSGD